ncbi:MAG: globin domain-containing protein, partial [Myxococcota bacterium]
MQRSWAQVRPISDAAATLFYDRLFELDPSVRPLFKNDMTEQKKKLMQTLNVAVDGLRDVGRLVPILEELGVRHAGYMVQDHHYDRVGESLLWTLEEGLGDGFTAEIKAAWTEVYTLIAKVMTSAAARSLGAEPSEESQPSEPTPTGDDSTAVDTPAAPADTGQASSGKVLRAPSSVPDPPDMRVVASTEFGDMSIAEVEEPVTQHFSRDADEAPSGQRPPIAPAAPAKPVVQPVAASAKPGQPLRIDVPEGLVVQLGGRALNVNLSLDPVTAQALASMNRRPRPAVPSRRGGLGMALALGLVCGVAVLAVVS